MPRRYVAGRWLDFQLLGTLREGLPPILLLHHGFGHAHGWGDFPARLSRATGRTVLAYSRQGCGHSDRLDRARSRDYLHEEAFVVLPALMESFGLARSVLYGHSDGATIALLAASGRPDLVDSIIAEAPHVFVEPETVAGVHEVAQRFERDPGFRRRVRRGHADPEGAFSSWRDIWLDPAFIDWSIEEFLPAVKAPLLLLQGDADQFGTAAQIDTIRREFSSAVVTRIIPGCGHEPHRTVQALPNWVAEFLLLSSHVNALNH